MNIGQQLNSTGWIQMLYQTVAAQTIHKMLSLTIIFTIQIDSDQCAVGYFTA